MTGWDEGFLHIVFLSVVEIYGDFSLRFYAQTNKLMWLGHGIVGYIGVVYFLIQSLKHNNVLYVNGMWDGVSGIIESVASYVLLGDRLQKPSEYLGLVLIIVGVFLMKNGAKF
jgi:multidrug transporter EmrE-like cation transporter